MKKSIVATGLAPKVISLFLSLVMLVSITAGIDFSACAAGNSIQTATSITLGRTYNGSITQTNEKDVYKFTLSSSGRINISLKANIYETDYYLYDANGVEICNWRYCDWNENTQQMTFNETVDLTKGNYYFAVVRHNGTGNYNFSISFTTSSESFSEPQGGNNNSIAQAQAISLGTAYKGQLATNDERDVYRFTLSSSGRINISLKANIYETDYYLYDANGVEICNWRYCDWNENTQQMTFNETVDLTKGNYYFAVVRHNGTGNYNFSISFTTSSESFSEPQGGNNNSIAQAQAISLGTAYKGQLATNDERDVYKFTLSSSGRINISLKANIYETDYYLYDANGVEICNWRYCDWNDNTQQMKLNEIVDLSKGTYYFAVVRHNGTGNYNFSICCHSYSGTITKQPTCTANGTRTYTCKNCNAKRTESIHALGHKYTTKVVKPTYTSEGYTLHTCTRCKKSYKDKKTKKLVLKNTSISKITAAKKAFTIKWKKQSAATGYQIQYSTSSKLKGAKTVTITKNKTTSKKISKLKAKKKYYVRIRTYKTVKVNGKNTRVYSSWSKVKSVKTK